MTTNSTEYQKEYQREYRKTHPQKQYKKKRKVKFGSKEVKISELKPPKVETSVLSPFKSGTDANIEMKSTSSTAFAGIDINSMPREYWNYCSSSDAKRAWGRAKFGIAHRGSTEQLKKDVKETNVKLKIIKGLPPDLLKELKEVLEERRKKNAD